MTPTFTKKAFQSLLWLLPVFCLTGFTAHQIFRQSSPPPATIPPVKVPVQVITPGEAPRIIYVELDTNSIPEPSTLLLLPISAALIFRRNR